MRGHNGQDESGAVDVDFMSGAETARIRGFTKACSYSILQST